MAEVQIVTSEVENVLLSPEVRIEFSEFFCTVIIQMLSICCHLVFSTGFALPCKLKPRAACYDEAVA